MIKRIISTVLIFFIASKLSAGEKVFINQIGYLTSSNKIVYVAKSIDSFKVVDIHSGDIFFRGKFDLYISNDLSTGLTTYKGDFSSLKRQGEYVLVTSSYDSSYRFKISDTVYNESYRKALKGFYFQRCGSDILSSRAGAYSHAKCHQNDGAFHVSTQTSGLHFATGGWHDAGDYGKYVVNAGISVGTLLLGYELNPLRFNADDLNIPESKNGIPDLLDEVRYELEWLLKMQDTSTGGVYTKLTRVNFENFIMPEFDNGFRYIYEISSAATADFTAMMGKASRIYKKFDPDFAKTCLNAAKKSWNYLYQHPAIVPVGGFKNPSGTVTGEYGDSDDRDERLWASAEMFISTSEDLYHNYFLSHYQESGMFTNTMSWPNVRPLALITYLTSEQIKKNVTVSNQILQALNNYCQILAMRRLDNGFNLVISANEYYWGSNSQILNQAILLYICGKYVNTTLYTEIALEQLNYIFGVNFYNLSYVTGLGSKSVMKPHHRPSGSDGILNPVPGLLAGGPCKNLDDNILKANFNSNSPPATCYVDHQDSYASNEICINWNAPLVFLTGCFFLNNSSSGIKIDEKKSPVEIEINQNYPNPFNHSTNISFFLIEPQIVNLAIYNILGQEIYRESLGFKESGNHLINWNAVTNNRSSVSSGVYYYFIQGKRRSEIKKLLVLY